MSLIRKIITGELLKSSFGEVVLSLERRVLCKAQLRCRDRKGGKGCSWGFRGVLKEDSEMLKYVCVCKIPLCPTFPASGSAGKGSRPMDLGPDYKPPLGGECGAKLLHGHTLLPVWFPVFPGNTPAAVPELLLCGKIPVPTQEIPPHSCCGVPAAGSSCGISVTRAAPSVV